MVDNVIFEMPHISTADWLTPVMKAWAFVMVSMLLGFVLTIWGTSKLLPNSTMFSFAVLKASTSKEAGYTSFKIDTTDFIGKIAVATTDLRPAGNIQIEEDIYNAVASNGFIEKGTAVKVIKNETGTLHVRKA